MSKSCTTEPLLSNNIEKPVISKLNKIIIPICFTITLLSSIDRSNLNYAANQFCTAINLSYSAYGTGASLFYITFILFSLPNCIILEKVGAPLWLGFLSFFWGITAAAMAFIKNEIQYYIIRLILGMAEAGALPGTFHYISFMYPDNYSTYVYGIIVSALLIAPPISAPLAAVLLSLDDILGLEGWQWLFIVEGLMSVFFSIITIFGLPKNVEYMKSLNFEEKKYLKNLIILENDDSRKKIGLKQEFWCAISDILKIRKYWILALSSLILQVSYTTIQYFLTLIISTMFSDTGSVADSETCSSTDLSIFPTLLTAIPYVFSSIASILVGKYIAYIKNYCSYLSVNCFIACCSFAAWTLFQDNLVIGIFSLTLAVCTAFANTFTVFIKEVKSCLSADKNVSATGFGLFTSIIMMSGIIGPLAAGYIIDYYGYTVCVLVMSGLLLIVSGIFFLMKDNLTQIKDDDII